MTTLPGWSSQRRDEELRSLQQKFVAELSFLARSSRLEQDDD